MNEIAKRMREVMEAADYLKHVGVAHDENPPGRGSGRFPYGSGENKYQRLGREFYDAYQDLVKEGKTEKEIAEILGCYDPKGKPSTGVLRDMKAVAKNNVRKENVRIARELRDQGYTLTEIGKELGGINESSVRSLLNNTSETNMLKAEKTAEELKRVLAERGTFIDIGAGVEDELSVALGMNISETRLSEAIFMLKQEGYVVDNVLIPQANNLNGQKTTTRILAPPGTDPKEFRDYSKITPYTDYISHDGGDTITKAWEYPASLDHSRLQIRYAEDGGIDKDGVIEIRRGVPDLDLKGSHYCQTRILVDGTHYLKGMAVYGDNFPPGVDVIFNTNKTKDKAMMDVLKPIKDPKEDPENPFGSLIKDKERGGQYNYTDPVTGEKKLGLINKTRDEGDWDEWSDASPSQFISKQPKPLIERQLNLTLADKNAEYEEIMSVTNPTLRKKLLVDFAGKCDKTAEELKAAALPGQKYRVILPLTTIKDNEIYAPNLKDGTMVALIRFPHAGPHEIPILRVNNNNAEGDRMISKNAIDAVGITKKTADVLSGADFDGDTALVIPMSDRVRITSRANEKIFQELRNFDPHTEYAGYPGMKPMTEKTKQREMGVVSNLITDMYIRGASAEELIRATKHSMVVIDAVKHGLDYKRSERENNIKELKQIYQKHKDDDKYGGASTIISLAGSEDRVEKRQGAPRIIKETGEVKYKRADDATYINKKGEIVTRTTPVSKMEKTFLSGGNAFDLVSDINNPVENAYARFANSMHDIATKARYTSANTKGLEYSKSAYLAFKNDVDDLLEQVRVAELNRPRERAAQTIANAKIQKDMRQWKEARINNGYPEPTRQEYNEQKKKISTKALTNARSQVGAERSKISLTDRQWQAINLGAINQTNLNKIFKYADMDDVRARSMPRQQNGLSPAKEAKLKAMRASGYSNAEIANSLGVSASTISNYIKQELTASRGS